MPIPGIQPTEKFGRGRYITFDESNTRTVTVFTVEPIFYHDHGTWSYCPTNYGNHSYVYSPSPVISRNSDLKIVKVI